MIDRLVVVLLTYERTEYALRTIDGLGNFLRFNGEIGFYLADDGSDEEHHTRLLNRIDCFKKYKLLGHHNEKSAPGKNWPGKSWNRAWKFAHKYSPVVLWMEDDWELRRPLDVTPYVRLLDEREDIGMVRLGHLAIDLNTTSRGHNGIHYLQMWRNMQYAYSGNPHLKHQRFLDAYGLYNETIGPGDTEVDFDGRFRAKEGPEIYWPVDVGGWGIFAHIGQEQSYQ